MAVEERDPAAEVDTASETRAEVSSQLRAAREDLRGLREIRKMPTQGLEVREVPNGHGGNDLVCTGYASVTCASRDDSSNSYEMEDMFGTYMESTIRGFAQKSISEGCDAVFWPNHGSDGALPMARTKAGSLRLSEDLTGLHYEARLNASRADVQILRAAIEDGTVSESSFAFRVTRQEWNGDYTERWITEVSLDRGDVSPVSFGANPHTGDYPLSMRSATAVLAARGIDCDAFLEGMRGLMTGGLTESALAAFEPICRAYGIEDIHRALGVEPATEVEERAEEGFPPPTSRLVFLPDHTQAARAALTQLRGSNGR